MLRGTQKVQCQSMAYLLRYSQFCSNFHETLVMVLNVVLEF